MSIGAKIRAARTGFDDYAGKRGAFGREFDPDWCQSLSAGGD
jgi:hypothetical protein